MVASNNSFLESTVVGFRAYRLAYVIDISSWNINTKVFLFESVFFFNFIIDFEHYCLMLCLVLCNTLNLVFLLG
jgi:hypothetical protein